MKQFFMAFLMINSRRFNQISAVWLAVTMSTLGLTGVSQSAYSAETPLRFENFYNKPSWQNPWVVGGTITAVTIAAAAFTTMTAGTGAPAAALGVGKVASLVAGGGAGSYMAGLSMIGGWVGGNAIVGAAILNSASVALLGSTAYKGFSFVAIAGLGALKSVGSLMWLQHEDGEKRYLIDIPISHDIGKPIAQELLQRFKAAQTLASENRLTDLEKALNLLATDAQEVALENNFLENAVPAMLLLHNLGKTDAFLERVVTEETEVDFDPK